MTGLCRVAMTTIGPIIPGPDRLLRVTQPDFVSKAAHETWNFLTPSRPRIESNSHFQPNAESLRGSSIG